MPPIQDILSDCLSLALIERFGNPEHTTTYIRILEVPTTAVLFPLNRICEVDGMGDLFSGPPVSNQMEMFRAFMLKYPVLLEIEYVGIEDKWRLVVGGPDEETADCHVNGALERLTAWNVHGAAQEELAKRWYAELMEEQQAESDPLGLYDMDILL